MAIANTNSVAVANWSTSNPATASFDCSGGDILIVECFFASATTAATATYNGVSMTQLTFGTDAGGNKNAVFYLVNPASGSNTISISRTGGGNTSAVAAAYSGVDTSAPIDASAFDSGSNTLVSSFSCTNVTVGDANNWFIACFRPDGPIANTTSSEVSERISCATVPASIFDSNGTIGSTGSQNITFNMSPSRRIWGITTISLQVAAAAASRRIFSIT